VWRRRTCSIWTAAAGLALAAAVPVAAQSDGDAKRGLAYAQKICAECHAVLSSQTASPRPGLATFKTIANTPGMTATAIAVWLQTPHATMPNLMIETSDRDDVIAYITSLKEPR
jgi:mono/diheme cytochrome c family protein